MKKTYIQPETIVVSLNVRDNVMISGSGDGKSLLNDGGDTNAHSITETDAREVIQPRGAWEEW